MTGTESAERSKESEVLDIEASTEGELVWEDSRLEEEIHIQTDRGNLTLEAAYILADYFNGETNYGFRELMDGRSALEEKGVIEDESYQIDVPDDLEEILEEARTEDLYNNYGILENYSNEENIQEVKQAAGNLRNEEDRSYCTSRDIAGRVDLSVKEVSRVFGYFEAEHSLERERFRHAFTSNTTWNLEYLDEEDIIA